MATGIIKREVTRYSMSLERAHSQTILQLESLKVNSPMNSWASIKMWDFKCTVNERQSGKRKKLKKLVCLHRKPSEEHRFQRMNSIWLCGTYNQSDDTTVQVYKNIRGLNSPWSFFKKLVNKQCLKTICRSRSTKKAYIRSKQNYLQIGKHKINNVEMW